MPRDFCDSEPEGIKPYFAEVLIASPRLDDLPLRSGRVHCDTPRQAILLVERYMRAYPDQVVRGEIYRAGLTEGSHHTRIDIIHPADLIPGNFNEDDLDDLNVNNTDDVPTMHY